MKLLWQAGMDKGLNWRNEGVLLRRESDAGDGINSDWAAWAEAKVTLEDGRDIWIGDLPIRDERKQTVTRTLLDPVITYQPSP
jgi:hypothetical protein